MTRVVETTGRAAVSVRFRRAVLGTCCVPWTDDDRFDEPRFRRTVRALNRRGLTDLYIFGTAARATRFPTGSSPRSPRSSSTSCTTWTPHRWWA